MNVQDEVLNHLFRADLYRVLALAFDTPTDESVKEIQEIAKELLEFISRVENFKNIQNSLGEFLKNFPPKAREIEGEYHHLFNTQATCPSSEGNFQMVERGPIIGDVCAFYEAFHMKVVERQGPPDSLKMELGFMSWMALKTVQALEQDLEEENKVVQEAQGKFLGSHLGRWIKPFSNRLKEVTFNTFYTALADLLVQWVYEDCKYLKATPVSLPDFLLKEDKEEEVSCSLGNFK